MNRFVLPIALSLLLSMASALWASDQPVAPAPPPETTVKTLDDLKAAIEKIRVETRQPAIGIAVVNKNGVEWAAGLGVRNRATQAKADADTLFRMASASKMFSSLAILKLVEEGKLRLDDKLHDLAPDLQFKNRWEATHPILIAHLLEHTTGWDSKLGEYAREAPDQMSLQEGLAEPVRVDARTSRWVPGTRYAYSNTGPVVAAYVVEKVSNMKFEAYVQENLLRPLGMTSSTYFKNALWERRGVTAYVNGNTEKYAHVYSRPASSMNTSANDMARLLQFFIHRGQVDGTTLLTPASIDRMETPTTTLGAAQGIASGYGLTMGIMGYKESRTAFYGHGGNLPGNILEFYYAPALQAGFAFMLNDQNGEAHDRLLNLLRDYVLRDSANKPVKAMALPAKFRQLDGQYRLVAPQAELMRMKTDLLDTMTLTTSGAELRQEPFFGGRMRHYYALNDRHLVSTWTGLPSLAIVNDPLLGETVQIEGDLYQRISSTAFAGRLVLLASLVIFSASSFLFALVWIVRWVRGAIPAGATIQVRGAALMSSIALLAIIVSASLLPNDPTAMSANPTTYAIFILTIVYPVVALGSLLVLLRKRSAGVNRWVYWHSALVIAVHVLFVAYLASYGFIGFRIWA